MPSRAYADRYAWISFGSAGELDHIRKAANAKGLELSAYIRAACEEFEKPREEGSQDINQLRAKIRPLQSDLDAKDLLLAKLSEEVRKLRDSEFLKDSWEADINTDLIKILQTGPIREYQIFVALEAKDIDVKQAIANQLYLLERSGFAVKNQAGWKWK